MARTNRRASRRRISDQASSLRRLASKNVREVARLTNACSNLENAVDSKKEELRIVTLHAHILQHYMTQETMDEETFMKAAYEMIRHKVQRPRKALNSSQRSALNRLFGPGDPARNILGFPELELWFLNKHPMYVPGPAPIPVWQEPPPVDEVYADGAASNSHPECPPGCSGGL